MYDATSTSNEATSIFRTLAFSFNPIFTSPTLRVIYVIFHTSLLLYHLMDTKKPQIN